MSFWSFTPDDPYRPTKRKPYKPKGKVNPATAWIAPEHLKMALDMKRDYPRNDWGEKIGEVKFLKIDPRPAILRPQPQTVIGWL